jgi:hypothetical protein
MLGPVQVLVVEVGDDDAAAAVLASAGALPGDAPVRCLDAFSIEVDADGIVTSEPGDGPSLALFSGDDPADEAAIVGPTWSLADAIPPGRRGVVLLLEHRWAVGFVGNMEAAGAALAHESWLHDDDRVELEALLGGRPA